MNPEYPPLPFIKPQVAKRRAEKPRYVPLAPEIVARRAEKGADLLQRIQPLSRALRDMSAEERGAVFLKLEHERPINLAGTDLKLITEPSPHFSLVIPRQDDLSKLEQRIQDYAVGPLKKGQPPQGLLIAPLIAVGLGAPEDRMSESFHSEYLRLVKRAWVTVEIEMYSSAQYTRDRRVDLQYTRNAITKLLGGRLATYGSFFEHEEIRDRCRAVLRCTGVILKGLVEDPQWQRRIVWFDTKPRFETHDTTLEKFSVAKLGAIDAPDDDAPVVCIVDSGVTVGNPFLKPVSRQQLFRSFLRKNANTFDEHGHGSGVASLAAYYALNLAHGALNEGRVWIASARILDQTNQVEDERLLSRILEDVVRTFVPLGVRIFNLSVNVLNRYWHEEAKRTVPRKSWIARTIDRLSREHDIVFVVSTGNILSGDVSAFTRDGTPYPAYLSKDEARILDPAQAALALTVGSIAPTTKAGGHVGGGSAIAAQFQPSPFSRCGPGMAREIKPELVEFGGNYFLDHDGGQVRANPAMGIPMATKDVTPPYRHDVGTSYAAPRVSHRLARVLADAETLLDEHVSAPLMKAFLVNSALYRGENDGLRDFREALPQSDPKHWLNVVGYGFPDDVRATDCDRNSVLLFYQGDLKPDTVAYFDIPVPATLTASRKGARLTVTVAHAPEVQRTGIEQYLGTNFKWRMFRGDVPRDEVIHVMSVEDPDNDTGVQERPNELHFALGVNRRSRGTIQHDAMTWTHSEQFSQGHYTLAIAAYKRWSTKPVPFAVVVRLEDIGKTVDVYQEVQAAVEQIRVRA